MEAMRKASEVPQLAEGVENLDAKKQLEKISPIIKTIDATKLTGEQVKLQIESKVGEGNNGIVYKAISEELGGTLAVKQVLLKEEKGKDVNFFIKSIVNLITFSSSSIGCHPNIICTFGIIVNPRNLALILPKNIEVLKTNNLLFSCDAIPNNQVYMLYEFIKGPTLREVIDNAQKNQGGAEGGSTKEVNYKLYGHQILSTLDYLHKKMYVHLDIKPENFMINSETDTVKFIDTEFLCKRIWPHCGVKGMSISYTSPEAYYSMIPGVKMPDKLYLPETDVFATGLVIYEMIMKKKGMSSIFFFERAEKEGKPELDLEFSEDKIKWKPLLQSMVVREYHKRITIAQALAQFEELLEGESKGGKRKTRKFKKRKGKSRKHRR
jgi:serine/threonine protein kinase